MKHVTVCVDALRNVTELAGVMVTLSKLSDGQDQTATTIHCTPHVVQIPRNRNASKITSVGDAYRKAQAPCATHIRPRSPYCKALPAP
jgi:hypothetical protein